MAKVLTRSSNTKSVSTTSKYGTPSQSTGSYEIFVLSDSHLERIFGFLSYRELTSARSVCRWFYHVIGGVMNKKFKSLAKEVEMEMEEEKSEEEPSEGRLKVPLCSDMHLPLTNMKFVVVVEVLSVLLSEIRIIESHCLDYIDGSMFYFFGGKILDFFDYIVKESRSSDMMCDVSELFILVDYFLTTFDAVSEPVLLERSYHLPFSWFAKKLVDVLECYTCVEHFVAVEPIVDGTRVKWTGKYTATPIHSLLPPPFLANSTEGVKADMDTILKYVRNHVRWNNILDIIKNSCENSKRFEDRVTLENGGSEPDLNSQKIICERVHQDQNDPYDPVHMEINIGLFAHEIFAPSRFKELFGMMTNVSKSSDEEEESKSTEGTTVDRSSPLKHDYEMDLTIEITFKEPDADAGQMSYRTRTYQICHIENCCYIASNTAVVH